MLNRESKIRLTLGSSRNNSACGLALQERSFADEER